MPGVAPRTREELSPWRLILFRVPPTSGALKNREATARRKQTRGAGGGREGPHLQVVVQRVSHENPAPQHLCHFLLDDFKFFP